MGRGSFLSLGLFILPIAVSIGVLVGLDAFRKSNGQSRLFLNNKIKNSTYCQKAFGITPTTYGQQYTLNPNQWGWNEGDPGALCMSVTTYENGTYPTKLAAPAWSITWQYPPGPPTAPVHGFPNIKLDSDSAFPVRVSDVAQIDIDAEWMYGVGDIAPTVLDTAALSADLVNTNVAIDMFLDSDASKAQDTTAAKYEIMVWLATFGSATQPIGLAEGVRATQVLGGTTFNLYFGTNDQTGQVVLTWSAVAPITNFVADIAPLLKQDVTALGGPSPTDYLGYMALGSEALSATSNVTLSVPKLSMNVTRTS